MFSKRVGKWLLTLGEGLCEVWWASQEKSQPASLVATTLGAGGNLTCRLAIVGVAEEMYDAVSGAVTN